MNAFMAGAKGDESEGRVHGHLHQQLVRPAQGQGGRLRDDRQGADVLYAERFGVSDAAKEKGKLAIGNVINTQDKYPDTVVSSALWNMGADDRPGAQERQGRRFKAEDYGVYSTMKYKGSELAAANLEKKVPADIVAKVQAKQKAILDASFKVVVDDSQPADGEVARQSPARTLDDTRQHSRTPPANTKQAGVQRAGMRWMSAPRATAGGGDRWNHRQRYKPAPVKRPESRCPAARWPRARRKHRRNGCPGGPHRLLQRGEAPCRNASGRSAVRSRAGSDDREVSDTAATLDRLPKVPARPRRGYGSSGDLDRWRRCVPRRRSSSNGRL